MTVTVYKFLTIEDFNTSNELCNTYYGIPINETHSQNPSPNNYLI